MFRHHRILYRRLLRGQSSEDLLALRGESALFPTLLCLIDDELQRRTESLGEVGSVSASTVGGQRPFVAPQRGAALS